MAFDSLSPLPQGDASVRFARVAVPTGLESSLETDRTSRHQRLLVVVNSALCHTLSSQQLLELAASLEVVSEKERPSHSSDKRDRVRRTLHHAMRRVGLVWWLAGRVSRLRLEPVRHAVPARSANPQPAYTYTHDSFQGWQSRSLHTSSNRMTLRGHSSFHN